MGATRPASPPLEVALIPFACLRLPNCNNLRWETTKRMAMTTDISHHTRHTLFAKQCLEQSATYFTLHTSTCSWNARCAGELLFGTGDAQCALERETQAWNACVCHNWDSLYSVGPTTYLLIEISARYITLLTWDYPMSSICYS